MRVSQDDRTGIVITVAPHCGIMKDNDCSKVLG
jgi:hypothetical protein